MSFLLVIICAIILISAMVGLAAFFADIKSKKESDHKPYGPYEQYIKRPLDAFLATGALIVLSPVLLVVALLVMIKLGIPVLFVQERPGLNKKIFKIHKFRTMTNDKDETGQVLPDEKRLTIFGRFLRSTSLDELPELLNIIKGNMAIVGPRPLMPKYLQRYNTYQARRHEIRPGLTGLAQIHGRNAISWEDRFDWDIKYVDHITFVEDCKIIWRTFLSVIRREGISSDTSVTMEEFMGTEAKE